jgi:hypothetical protein
MPDLTARPVHCPHFESLEPRALFTGVTLITHGFGGSAGDWVTAMGNLIAQQSGPLANQPRYLMTATDTGTNTGPITVNAARISGAPAPADWGSREIIVLLDWSALAGSFPFGGHHRTTAEVADAVAAKLLAANSIPDLATPLAQLPLHLLGHSRGASLVSELARGLGQRGVWVDQLSYFDPHPVDGVRDPSFLGVTFDFDDAPMHVYDNVIFADNYWRTDGDTSFDFTGESVNGAYNLQLNEADMTGTGYSVEHSDTHLFYHGTIGKPAGPFSNGDGGATIGANWYSHTPPRETIGWRYSRIAASGTRPSVGLKFSGAPRDALALTASGANVWDNVQINGLLSDFTLPQGQSIAVPAQWADQNHDATVTIGLDRDDNPYNGVFARGGAAFATSSVGGDASMVSLNTADIAGRFRVYARVTNGTNTRYFYAPGRATITASDADNTWVGPASGNWSDGANWSTAAPPSSAQRVAIFDSAVTLASSARIAALNLNESAKLDLRTNSLIVDYAAGGTSPFASLSSQIALARGVSGDWDGVAGITSSVAATTSGLTTLGIAEAAANYGLSPSETIAVSGQTVDGTSVVIKYTYAGDANLDGVIDGGDYGVIDNFAQVPGAYGYFNGDFNYAGLIDGGDYGMIDNNIQAQGAVL